MRLKIWMFGLLVLVSAVACFAKEDEKKPTPLPLAGPMPAASPSPVAVQAPPSQPPGSGWPKLLQLAPGFVASRYEQCGCQAHYLPQGLIIAPCARHQRAYEGALDQLK